MFATVPTVPIFCSSCVHGHVWLHVFMQAEVGSLSFAQLSLDNEPGYFCRIEELLRLLRDMEAKDPGR